MFYSKSFKECFWDRSAKRRNRRATRSELVSSERLEQRLALAVVAYPQLASGLITNTTLTVIADDGDDMYLQVISPATPGSAAYNPSLLVSNNSSFLSYVEVPDFNKFASVLATNGSNAVNSEILGHAQNSDGYPFIETGSFQSEFVLPTGHIDDGSFWVAYNLANFNAEAWTPITGRINNGVGGLWDFSNSKIGGTGFTSAQFTPIGSPTGPAPTGASFFQRGRIAGGGFFGSDGFDNEFDTVMQVNWDNNALGSGGMAELSPPVLETITYDGDDDGGALNSQTLVQALNTLTSSSYKPTFSLPLPANVTTGMSKYDIVPGTLSGTINIQRTLDGTVTPISFSTLTPESSTLVFATGIGGAFVATGLFDTTGLYGDDPRQVTGTLTHSAAGLPQISLRFSHDPSGTGQEVGQVTVDAKYAIFTSGNTSLAGVGGNFTLSPGQDFSPALTVDMLTPGAKISIDSPLLYLAGVSPGGSALPGVPLVVGALQHAIDLRGSEVHLNAQVSSNTSLNVRDSKWGLAKAEEVFFNSAVAAKTYDIRLKDDLNTDAIARSKLFVSTTGSLAGILPSGAAAQPLPSESLYVQIENGDVLIEGVVASKLQSYIINSKPEFVDAQDPFGAANRAPYYLTTVAVLSGANTGMLLGGTVAITLGNDTPTSYDDVGNGGSSAFNVVNIQTTIDSLRIRAADRKGNAVQTPFPYLLTVSETDKIRIDAVAASSLPVSLAAIGDISFNATLASASDVSVDSTGGNLWLNAPMSTNFGTISLSANELSVLNSVRVLDTNVESLSTDIILTSRAGNLKLVGPISAINTIQLEQSGGENAVVRGSLSGNARVIADHLVFHSGGSVDLRTAVRILDGTAYDSVSISELDDIDVQSLAVLSGLISLTASGRDLTVARDDGRSTAALRAVLQSTSSVFLAAPNGSVDVRFANSALTTLGIKADINSGKALSMMAQGNVKIESDGGAIDVLDAPLANSSAVRVRAASTLNLDGIYAQRTPGTFASTLSANPTSKSSLNALAGLGLKPGIDGVSNLRIGDWLLLKDQSTPEQNGIYQIVVVGSTQQEWVLVRASSFDTTQELAPNTIVVAGEGDANKGMGYKLDRYDNLRSVTPKVAIAVTNRAESNTAYSILANSQPVEPRSVNSRELRAVSTSVLAANFDSTTGLLTSTVDGAIPRFDGVELQLGDLVLVRLGSVSDSGVQSSISNGVYRVSNAGSVASAWDLTLVTTLDPNVDPPENDFDTGLFVVAEGTLRTRLTGQAFSLGYNSLGNAGAVFLPINSGPNDPQAHAGSGITEIGSQDANDTVRFIVSTNLGTNVAVGSLGKMLSIANLNEYRVLSDDGSSELQKESLGFVSRYRGPIILTQELPPVLRKLQIDATSTRVEIGSIGVSDVVIDGSRISKNSEGLPVLPGQAINGFNIQGAVADGTMLAGIRMGGFSRGAAVLLNGVSDVLVDRMSLGQDNNQRRFANKYDVSIVNGAAGLNTVSNSLIYSATTAGITVSDAASSVRLVGNTIGAARFENAIGVEFREGTNYLGLNQNTVGLRRVSSVLAGTTASVTAAAGINGTITYTAANMFYAGQTVSVTGLNTSTGTSLNIANMVIDTASATQFTVKNSTIGTSSGGGTAVVTTSKKFYLPSGYVSLRSLYVGLGVSSNRMVLADPEKSAQIQNIAVPDAQGRTLVTITGGEFTGASLSLLVDFGLYAFINIDSPVIPYPQGVDINGLYIGQTVQGLGINGLAVVQSIDTIAQTITLSKDSISDGMYAVVFGFAARNTVANNNRGVVLGDAANPSNGAINTIENTDIGGSIFDGVKVLGGTAYIGGGTLDRIGIDNRQVAKDLAFTGNAIYGNGSAGIRIMPTAPIGNIHIKANRIGVTMVNAVNINKAGNIVGNSIGVGVTPSTTSAEPIQIGSYAVSNGVITVTLASHGLVSGAKVWLALDAQAKAYSIVRVNSNKFTILDSSISANSGTAVVFKYGSKMPKVRAAQLDATGQIDYEGNVHGLVVGQTGGGGGNGNGGGGIAPRPKINGSSPAVRR